MAKPKENKTSEKEKKIGEKNTGKTSGGKTSASGASGGRNDYEKYAAMVAVVAVIAFFAVILFSGFQSGQPGASNEFQSSQNGQTALESAASYSAGTTGAVGAAGAAGTAGVEAGETVTQNKIMSLVAESENALALMESNASVEFFFLNASSVAELAKKRAGIYGDLGGGAERNGVFEVHVASGNRAVLMLVGVDGNGEPTAVLRELLVGSIVLGDTKTS